MRSWLRWYPLSPYIIAGFVQSAWIALPIAIALMLITMLVDPRDKRGAERRIKKKQKSRGFFSSALIKIGATGFEPRDLSAPAEPRATKLRHTPEVNSLYQNPGEKSTK